MPALPQTAAESLKIYVLEGQGAVNSLPRRSATTPVVEVRDENEQPVAGAEVTFELPPAGPGGSFPGPQQSLKVRTNTQGQAAAPFTPNTEAGRFSIKITATMGNRSGRAVITQTNSLQADAQPVQAGGRKFGWWKIALVAGAGAAAGGIVWATRDGVESSPTIILTPGSPSFSGPR